MKIRLVCGNCGKIEYFEDGEIEGHKLNAWDMAYQKGWDTVERFGYNACDRCPGVSVYFPMLQAQEARQYPVGSAQHDGLMEKAAKATLEFDPATVDIDKKIRETIAAAGGVEKIREMAREILDKETTDGGST